MINNIKYPVIGIPKWEWKSKLCKYAKRHPNIIKVSSENLCYELTRHFELLTYFDCDNSDYKQTEYYKYQSSTGKKDKEIYKNIRKFKRLYRTLRVNRNAFAYYAIVTDDGCRIDGSHRLSILIHLGEKEVNINMVKYEDLFSPRRSARIRSEVIKYRKKIYNL